MYNTVCNTLSWAERFSWYVMTDAMANTKENACKIYSSRTSIQIEALSSTKFYDKILEYKFLKITRY